MLLCQADLNVQAPACIDADMALSSQQNELLPPRVQTDSQKSFNISGSSSAWLSALCF
jgi:hypothetical protein